MIKNILRIFAVLIGAALIAKVCFLTIGHVSKIPLTSLDGIFSILYGIRFDATAAAAIALPAISLQFLAYYTKLDAYKLSKFIISLGGIWIILTTMSDAIYAEDSGKHVTFELMTAQGSEIELIKTAIQEYWQFILLALVLCISYVWSLKRIPLRKTAKKHNVVTFSVTLFVWLFFTLTFIRGGWHDAPQDPMSAYKIGDSDKAYIAWSAPYSITYYLSKDKPATKVTQPATVDMLSELAQLQSKGANLDNLKQANIVFVLMESWVSIDMASYGSKTDATPNFDKYRESALTSHAMYADGYRTVQGIFASMCSYPNPNGFVVPNTQLQNNDYYCLPQILKDRGWDTRFVQGSGKGMVGAFAQTLGFTHSYGKKDYDFEYQQNEWGYMDGGIFKFTLNKIDEMDKNDSPFFIAINTGTTHSTYLPSDDDYIFGKDSIPHIRASVLHHADQALGKFLKAVKSRKTKRPTLVVLMADHTARIVEPHLARNSIPFLMFSTDHSVPQNKVKTSLSQRDVAPTIMDWLGGSVPWFTGQSLLNEKATYRSSFSKGSLFFWIDNRHLVTINSPDGTLQRCYTIDENTIKIHNASCDEEWVQPLYKQGRDFNKLTQDLLFKGKTMEYRAIPSIFPNNE